MPMASSNKKRIAEIKNMLLSLFSMEDLGDANNILDMKIIRNKKNKKLLL